MTQLGDLFPPAQALARQLRREIREAHGPAWSIPGAIGFARCARAGRAAGAARGRRSVRDDIAFLQYTGGTTGRPKGAILTHGNMVANVEQTAAWIGILLKEGEETVITALPLYHIFALTANLLVFLKLGGTNVLITNPRDIPRFVAELRKTRFTAITGVNTLFNALLDAPGFDAVCAASRGALKLAVAGGMAVQRIGRRALAAGDGRAARRGLRADRGLAHRVRAIRFDTARIQRQARPAAALHRGRDPRRARRRGARSARPARSACAGRR